MCKPINSDRNCFTSLLQSSKSRKKRSEPEAPFEAADVYILGTSSFGDNWKIEFAVLFPVRDGQAPQSLPPNEVVHIVEASKERIETSTAATIKNVKIAPAAEELPGCMTQHMVLYYIVTVVV